MRLVEELRGDVLFVCLSKSQAEYLEAMRLVEELRGDKLQLDKEIMELKMGRSSENLIKKKLFASEVRHYSTLNLILHFYLCLVKLKGWYLELHHKPLKQILYHTPIPGC